MSYRRAALGMGPARGLAIRRRHEFERQFLASPHLKLFVADQVDRFFADPRHGTCSDEGAPHAPPVLCRNANCGHWEGLPRKRTISTTRISSCRAWEQATASAADSRVALSSSHSLTVSHRMVQTRLSMSDSVQNGRRRGLRDW